VRTTFRVCSASLPLPSPARTASTLVPGYSGTPRRLKVPSSGFPRALTPR